MTDTPPTNRPAAILTAERVLSAAPVLRLSRGGLVYRIDTDHQPDEPTGLVAVPADEGEPVWLDGFDDQPFWVQDGDR